MKCLSYLYNVAMNKPLLLSLLLIISSCTTGLMLVDETPHVIGYSSKDKIETLNCLRAFDKAKIGIAKISHKIPFTTITADDGNGFALLGNDYIFFKIQSIDEEKFKSKITVHAEYKMEAWSYNFPARQYVDGCSELVEII